MGLFDFMGKPPVRKGDGIKRIIIRKPIKRQIVVRDDFWQDFKLAGWSLDKMGEDAQDLI